MGFRDDPRAKGTAYDDCHVLSPVRAGCRTNIRRPWPDVRASNGGTFSLAWGRAGRPQAADVLSQPGGLDRYLLAGIGDLAQRCHDLDGYPLALGAGDQSREHLFVLSADLSVGDTLADLSAQLVPGRTFHFGLGLRGGGSGGGG